MITDGTAGTSSGDGLANTLNSLSILIRHNNIMLILMIDAQNEYGVTGAQAFYYAARMYNSGSIPDVSTNSISISKT